MKQMKKITILESNGTVTIRDIPLNIVDIEMWLSGQYPINEIQWMVTKKLNIVDMEVDFK